MRQDDQRADATQADAANQRADANQADAVAADQSFDDTVEAVVKRLKANRAAALLCACLAVCETRMPYREAETLIGQRPELNLSTQNAHALLRIMIDCGGVEAEEVPEPACEPGDEKQDQPVDYTVRDAPGRAGGALARFEPTKRFGRMLQDEPAGYAQAYAIVLALCEDGATKAAIEQAPRGQPCAEQSEAGIPQLLHLQAGDRGWSYMGRFVESHGSRPADAAHGRVKRCSIAARANGRSHLR